MNNGYKFSIMPTHPSFTKRIQEINNIQMKHPIRHAGDFQYWEENDGQMWQRERKDSKFSEWEKVTTPYRFTETGFLVH